jgi:hypothetical protein
VPLDLLISMLSSGLSRGQGADQGRNTTMVVGKAFYLAKPGVMRRQLGPVESHFGACAIPPLTIARIKDFFYKRKKGLSHYFWPCLQNRCKRKSSRWGEGGKRDLFKL